MKTSGGSNIGRQVALSFTFAHERLEIGIEMAFPGILQFAGQGSKIPILVGRGPIDAYARMPARCARTLCTTMMVRPLPSRKG